MKIYGFRFYLFCCIHLASLLIVLSTAQALPVLPKDDIPWKFQTNDRVTTIGDIHGDLTALRFILEQNGIVDTHGKWIAGKEHLVLNGDLVAGGTQSLKLLNFIMDLEIQAAQSGGRVHPILGNHEIMISKGRFQFLSEQDKKDFAFDVAPGQEFNQENLFKAFSGNSKYAKWLRGLNSVIMINDIIFVHAGLGSWAEDTNLGQVNSSVRSWLRHYQAKFSPDQELPHINLPKETEWTVSPETGPMWTSEISDEKNDFKPSVNRMAQDSFNRILSKLGARFVVVGHIMTHDHKISLRHSLYGDKVIQTDTGNSIAYEGRLTAVSFSQELTSPRVWEAQRPNFCFHQLLGK